MAVSVIARVGGYKKSSYATGSQLPALVATRNQATPLDRNCPPWWVQEIKLRHWTAITRLGGYKKSNYATRPQLPALVGTRNQATPLDRNYPPWWVQEIKLRHWAAIKLLCNNFNHVWCNLH